MADENREIIWERVKLKKFPRESENFLEIAGKSETRGKCIIASEGMDAPDRNRRLDISTAPTKP